MGSNLAIFKFPKSVGLSLWLLNRKFSIKCLHSAKSIRIWKYTSENVTVWSIYPQIVIDFGESKHLSKNLRFRSPKLSPTDFGNLITAIFGLISIPWVSTGVAKTINFSNRERPEYWEYRIWFLIAFGAFDVFSVKSYLFFLQFFAFFFRNFGYNWPNRFCPISSKLLLRMQTDTL